MNANIQPPLNRRNIIISRCAVGIASVLLILGFASYNNSVITVIFAALSAVIGLFLAFLQVFTDFNLGIPRQNWMLIACTVLLIVSVCLIIVIFFKRNIANPPSALPLQNIAMPSQTFGSFCDDLTYKKYNDAYVLLSSDLREIYKNETNFANYYSDTVCDGDGLYQQAPGGVVGDIIAPMISGNDNQSCEFRLIQVSPYNWYINNIDCKTI